MGDTRAVEAAWRPAPGASRLAGAVRGLRALGRGGGRRLRILTIVHAGGGGTIMTNEDLMRALASDHDCFVLGAGPSKWVLWRASPEGVERVEEINFATPWRGFAPTSAERLSALRQAVDTHRIDVVHVRSLLGVGPEAIVAAKASQRPVVVSFHDFQALCPNIQLLDSEVRHCEGVCTSGADDCAAPAKWFESMPRLKHGWVKEWRARVAAALEQADAFVTTSPHAAALLAQHFPTLAGKVQIIEHGRDGEPRALAVPPGERPRVMALNILDTAKGAGVLEALMRRNASEGSPFEFHLLGGAPTAAADCVSHGPYERGALPSLISGFGPSFSLVPSLWPETFSHTLTESWLAGAPVLASNLGALRERISRDGGGWLLDPGDPDAWFDLLQAVRADPALWKAKAEEIARMQFRSIREMAQDYLCLYEELAGAPGSLR